MMKMKSERAFTYIDYAVLVIIVALISGSIIVAMEMLDISKSRNIISQIRTLDSATSRFIDKYRFMPGDLPMATEWALGSDDRGCGKPGSRKKPITSRLVGCDGDGNGKVTDYYNSSRQFNWEIASFWYHLSKAGMVKERYNGRNAVGMGFPENVNGKGGIHMFAGSEGLSHYYHLSATDNGDIFEPNMRYKDNFSPAEANIIEKKIDDQLPFEGVVRAFTGTFGRKQIRAAPNGDKGCGLNTDPVTYNVVYEAEDVCQLRVRFGS